MPRTGRAETMNSAADGAPLDRQVLLGALEATSDGVLIAGRDRRMIWANAAFAHITGYAPDELVGSTCRLMQGADTAPSTIEAIRQALDAGEAFRGEILNYKRSGEPFWNDLSITPVRGHDGAISHYIGITRDITARKSAEQAVGSTERRYRLLFDHSLAGIVLHSSTTEIIYANKTAAELLGVEHDDITGAVNTDPRWVFLAEDGSVLRVADYPVSRALATRAMVRSQIIGMRRGGEEVVWRVCDAYPVFDGEGKVSYVVTSFTDVTELKRAEHALRSSEQRLSLVLRGTNDAAWDWDLRSNELYYSPRWWQMLGYVPGELPVDAQLWHRLLHPDDRQRVDETLAGWLADGRDSYEIEFRLLHRHGHYVSVLSRGFIMRDEQGAAIRLSGANTDLTERNRAAAAIRESEARLRSFVEASPVPFVLVDDGDAVLYVNPACTAAYGYRADEVTSIDAWCERLYPNATYRKWVRKQLARRMEDSLRNARPVEPLEVTLRCKDGSEKVVLSSAVPLQGGPAGRRLVVMPDVTMQRQLERAVLEAASREQHRLGMDLHDGLGQVLTGLSLMLSSLASRARRGGAVPSAAELDEVAQIAAQCIATARAIAHGLSPVAPGFDGLDKALRRLAVAGLFGDMTVGVTLIGFEDAPLDQPVADTIYRIVQEALANAAKHGQARHAQIDARRTAYGLSLVITDDGVGLAHASRPPGLGMNIMRYRAHAIGGRLEFDSAGARGTVVRFDLSSDARQALVAGGAGV